MTFQDAQRPQAQLPLEARLQSRDPQVRAQALIEYREAMRAQILAARSQDVAAQVATRRLGDREDQFVGQAREQIGSQRDVGRDIVNNALPQPAPRPENADDRRLGSLYSGISARVNALPDGAPRSPNAAFYQPAGSVQPMNGGEFADALNATYNGEASPTPQARPNWNAPTADDLANIPRGRNGHIYVQHHELNPVEQVAGLVSGPDTAQAFDRAKDTVRRVGGDAINAGIDYVMSGQIGRDVSGLGRGIVQNAPRLGQEIVNNLGELTNVTRQHPTASPPSAPLSPQEQAAPYRLGGANALINVGSDQNYLFGGAIPDFVRANLPFDNFSNALADQRQIQAERERLREQSLNSEDPSIVQDTSRRNALADDSLANTAMGVVNTLGRVNDARFGAEMIARDAALRAEARGPILRARPVQEPVVRPALQAPAGRRLGDPIDVPFEPAPSPAGATQAQRVTPPEQPVEAPVTLSPEAMAAHGGDMANTSAAYARRSPSADGIFAEGPSDGLPRRLGETPQRGTAAPAIETRSYVRGGRGASEQSPTQLRLGQQAPDAGRGGGETFRSSRGIEVNPSTGEVRNPGQNEWRQPNTDDEWNAVGELPADGQAYRISPGQQPDGGPLPGEPDGVSAPGENAFSPRRLGERPSITNDRQPDGIYGARGMQAAVRDPQTGRIYTGANHAVPVDANANQINQNAQGLTREQYWNRQRPRNELIAELQGAWGQNAQGGAGRGARATGSADHIAAVLRGEQPLPDGTFVSNPDRSVTRNVVLSVWKRARDARTVTPVAAASNASSDEAAAARLGIPVERYRRMSARSGERGSADSGSVSSIGALSAGALGLGALALSDSSAAQDGSPELTTARTKVAQLEGDAQRFANLDHGNPRAVRQAQEFLQGQGLYLTDADGNPVKPDGVWGPGMTLAVHQYIDSTNSELQTARAELRAAEQQEASRVTRANPIHEIGRQIAPWLGAGIGLVLGHGSRMGDVRKVEAELLARNQAMDALLPQSGARLGARTATTRAANINQFWREGGAGANVPFSTTQTQRGFRARPNAADVSSLYPPGSTRFRGQDFATAGAAGLETALSGGGLYVAQQELAQAQAAADREPNEANLSRLERAKDMVKLAESFVRGGAGFMVGRLGTGLISRYPSARPNVAAAEMERMRLGQYLAPKRSASRSR